MFTLECEYGNNYTEHVKYIAFVITCEDEPTKINTSSSYSFYLFCILLPIIIIIVGKCIMAELKLVKKRN